jgi:tRNA(fMet)-specific endonuclease VapC
MRRDIELLQRFPFVDYSATAEARFQTLTHLVTKTGVRDLRIAAIALTNNLTVLTNNRRDFAIVPGLTIEDWTV